MQTNNSARSQGLTFWESAPYAAIGSLEWEFLGEREPPALNDLIATTMGGICIGEITYRISEAAAFGPGAIIQMPQVGMLDLRSIADDHEKFEETTGIDLLHLNAQGDRGNAALLVVNPMTEFDIDRNWSIVLSGSYFVRRTHYHYLDDVKANTFEVRLGATVHL